VPPDYTLSKLYCQKRLVSDTCNSLVDFLSENPSREEAWVVGEGGDTSPCACRTSSASTIAGSGTWLCYSHRPIHSIGGFVRLHIALVCGRVCQLSGLRAL
jgi:hypothetical protein